MKLKIFQAIAFFLGMLLFLQFNSLFSVSAQNTDNIPTDNFQKDGEEKINNVLTLNNFESDKVGEKMNNSSDLVVSENSVSEEKVWLTQSGNDKNSGAENSPVATLNRALELAENGGEIIVLGRFILPSDFKWEPHSKEVKISGDRLDCSNLSSLRVRDSVTFDDIDIIFKEGALLYACGNKFKIGENTDITGEIAFFGGEYSHAVESTDVTLLSGNYSYIYGGGNYADVKGDVNLYIGGKVNNLPKSGYSINKPHAVYGGCIEGDVSGDIHVTAEGNVNKNLDYKNHESLASIYGGCNGGNVNGKIELNVGEKARFNYIFGGGCGKKTEVKKGITLNFKGEAMSVMGGSASGDVTCDITLNFIDGWAEQVFGGCEKASVKGNIKVNLLGGTITRRIFGGCYNFLKRKFIFITWEDNCHVSGETVVNISDKVNLDFSFKTNGIDDLGISASSRHKKNFKDETAVIVFLNSKAKQKYEKNIGIKTGFFLTDWFLRFAKPYDEMICEKGQ